MPTVTLTSGRQFLANDGESILDAAVRADVSLAYSCRTGRCSTCKSQVRSGSTVALHDETGLSAADRAAGFVLSCVRTATTDVALAADDLAGVRLAAPRTWPCRIHTMEQLAEDVLKVTLRLPPTADFNYLAGQYINVIGPCSVRRSYSVANAQRDDKLIELHIKQVDGGAMSQYWFHQAKRNDLLRLNGPLGTFFLRDIAARDLIFLATGTGIAPVQAMLEALPQLKASEQPNSIHVYWGGRALQGLYFNPAQTHSAARYVPVLSRAGAAWKGARGHVQQALLQVQPNLASAVVFACGSDAMIHTARPLLLAAGLPSNRFFSDAFVCSADA